MHIVVKLQTFYITQNFTYNMFYNPNYNIHVYTLIILPIFKISVLHIPIAVYTVLDP